jgi:hypothetical protein
MRRIEMAQTVPEVFHPTLQHHPDFRVLLISCCLLPTAFLLSAF